MGDPWQTALRISIYIRYHFLGTYIFKNKTKNCLYHQIFKKLFARRYREVSITVYILAILFILKTVYLTGY